MRDTGRYRRVLSRWSDYEWDPPRWLVVAAVALTAVLYIAVARSAAYPVLPLDEVVMVGNSRAIAGVPGAWELQGSGFMPGLAILMVPLWWVTTDPFVVYAGGVWITVGVALATIWPLSRVAQLAGVSFRAGLVIASVVMLAPMRSLLANFLLSESLLLLATACLLVQGARLWTALRFRDGLMFGLMTGLVVLTHGRAVAIAVAVGLWCVLLIKRDWKVAVAAGGAAVVSSVGAYVVYVLVTSQVLSVDMRVETTFGGSLGRDFMDAVALVVGQLWYATVAWPALVIFGALWVARRLRGSGVAQLLLLMVVTGLILSTIQLDPQKQPHRLDLWFYGRYMDHLWAILAVIGLAVLIRVKWAAVSALVIGLAALVGLGMLFFTVPRVPAGARWEDLHILGVAPWLSVERYANDEAQPWLGLMGAFVAITALIAVLGLLRVWLLPVLAVLWTGLSVSYDTSGIDSTSGPRAGPSDALAFPFVPYEATIAVDRGLGTRANLVFFEAGSRETVVVPGPDALIGADILYTTILNTEPAGAGARVFAPSENALIIGWVYPGDVFDELDAKGLLLPATDSE